jgi:hypothetical protein
MSSAEFTEWRAMELVSPGQPERSDIQAALISWAVATFSLTRKKGATLPKISDFMLDFDKREETSAEERRCSSVQKLKTWLGMMKSAGRVVDKRKPRDVQ